MLLFLSENLGTLIVGLIVSAIAVAIVAKIIKDKRNGKSIACDCGCVSCPGKSIG